MINGLDFIQIAGNWAASSTVGEPAWRSSTSRAYYGAFHVARAFLEDGLGFAGRFRGHEAHSRVSNALIASGDNEAKEAGKMLSRLIIRRHTADYDLTDGREGVQRSAKHSVEDAHEIRSHILKAVENCQNAEVLTVVRSRVQAFIGRF